MNWKSIGKHVFYSPIYLAVVSFVGWFVYNIALIMNDFFLWISSDWIRNVSISIIIIWSVALVVNLLYKAGCFDV